jgi:NAD dependent epimerase/dehydratase family enzyme
MTEEQKPGSELVDELHSLGKQLTKALKSLWESEESQTLRQEIGEGFVELGRQVDTAVQSAQESEAAQQFSEQFKETVEKARESDFAAKLEEGLTTGLHELNQQLSKLASSMEPRAPAEEASPEGEVAPEGESISEAETEPKTEA